MRRQIESTQRLMRMLELIVDGTGTASLGGPAANQATLTDNGVGDYTITYAQPFGNTPVVAVTGITTGTIPEIFSNTNTALRIKTTTSTAAAGEKTASLAAQGLTLYSKVGGAFGNGITYIKTTGATAGSEVVSVTGKAITVQVESGVSTATQVYTKLIASTAAMNLITVDVTTGATAQTALTSTPLAGGVDQAAGATAPGDCDFHVLVIGSEIAEKY